MFLKNNQNNPTRITEIPTQKNKKTRVSFTGIKKKFSVKPCKTKNTDKRKTYQGFKKTDFRVISGVNKLFKYNLFFMLINLTTNKLINQLPWQINQQTRLPAYIVLPNFNYFNYSKADRKYYQQLWL